MWIIKLVSKQENSLDQTSLEKRKSHPEGQLVDGLKAHPVITGDITKSLFVLIPVTIEVHVTDGPPLWGRSIKFTLVWFGG